MRFVVIGAGAVGGVIGGRLHAAGSDVVLVARGEHGVVIQKEGLTLASPDGRDVLHMDCVTDVADVHWRDGDVTVLAVKSQDTVAVLQALALAVDRDTPVVCAQNGIDNERQALRLFTRVYALCVMLPAEHLEPGVVAACSAPVPGILHLGRYPSGTDEVAAAIAAALRAAGFASEARPDVMRVKARKLVTNLGNAIEALTGRAHGVGPVVRAATEEGERVLGAAGIDLASMEDDKGLRADLLSIKDIAGQGPRGGGSTWQSLARGTGSVETDYLNGEIVLLGRLHGIPTPVNEALRRLTWQAARDRRPPASMSPEDLLTAVGVQNPETA
jgi:2-dehydropantoate 2-reductase